MKISRTDLAWAEKQGVLAPGQDEALWQALARRPHAGARFDGVHVAYYAGALLVLGAAGWLLTRAWETLPGWALTGVAVGYALVFIVLSRWVWDRLGLRVPGGLLLTMAVGMTPLALYGVLKQFSLWPQGDPGDYTGFHVWVKGSWITLELGTLLAGLVALRYRRFAFLTAPIAVALWYLSMDLTPLLFGVGDWGWGERAWISVWFGLAMLVGAYAVDLRGRDEDLAFWIYLFGLLAFWGALSSMGSDRELGKFIYFLINLSLIGTAILLRRPMFVIFGGLGCLGYVGHLAHHLFEGSLGFSVALTFLGLALIALGVIYQRNHAHLQALVQRRLPRGLLALLPPRARG